MLLGEKERHNASDQLEKNPGVLVRQLHDQQHDFDCSDIGLISYLNQGKGTPLRRGRS